MRKSFLLLFLMALLPLAGWATITITTQPTLSAAVDYNGTAQSAITAGAVATSTNVPTIYYAVTSSASAPAEAADDWKTNFADAKATDAGTYYVYVKVTAEDEETLRQYVGEFTINKIDPTIATEASFVATALTYNGTAQNIVSTGAVANGGTITYGLAADGSFAQEYPTPTNAGTYYVYYNVTGDNNHNDKVIKSATSKEIGKKAFNITGDFTVTRSVASANYNGAEQLCPYVVTYVEGDVNEILDLTDDYTVTYSSSPTAVGAYTVTISAAGDNFSGSFTTDNLNTLTDGLGTWTINKKPITVIALDQEKTYDGTDGLPSEEAGVAYQIIGVVGEEVVTAPTLTVGGTAAGTQTITPSACGGANVGNYSINYVAGTLTINKKTGLVISAGNNNKAKGNADPTPLAEINVDGNIAADLATIKAACAVARDEGETVGTYTITLTVDATADVIKNYEYTANNGTFTITGGKVLITVVPKTKTYGEADPEFTYILSNNDGNALQTEPTLTRTVGENYGTYTITASGAVAPEGYGGIDYVEGTLTINKAPLKVVMKDQTLAIGDKVDALDQTLCTFTGLVKNDDLGIDDTAVDQAEIFTLGFEAGHVDGTGALNVAGTYDTGIEATLVSANYTWDAEQANGKLIVVDPAATIVLNRPNKAAWTADNSKDDAAAVITAADGENRAITFGDFAMLPEKWYPLVLPFATTVREVSRNFGYAIVNILNTANTDNTKIAFKLWMGELPANEPFVVKVDENINMNTVTFSSRSIASNDDPQVADASGVKFIGSYSHKIGFAANEYFFSTSSQKNGYYYGSATNTTYMAPLGAYFQLPENSAARTIEFEEPDGTTTAINIVAADNKVQSNDGWYTVGGMKLQGAPTQKGIYVRDGKKIVVK